MARYVALLRAINVGGTGKLPMAVLRSMCVAAGFTDVQTYIASGNVVFTSTGRATSVKAKLEARLRNNAGKPIGVVVRTDEEMADILKVNPFQTTERNTTYVVFLDEAPADNALETVTGRVDEELHLGRREIYIYYPHGMGRSKLRVPAAKTGTARNLNTVAALVKLSCGENRSL